jgi:hypothetical protein
VMEMAEQLLCKWKKDCSDKNDRSDDMKKAFSQTAQRLKDFFPIDSHPDPFSTINA